MCLAISRVSYLTSFPLNLIAVRQLTQHSIYTTSLPEAPEPYKLVGPHHFLEVGGVKWPSQKAVVPNNTLMSTVYSCPIRGAQHQNGGAL